MNQNDRKTDTAVTPILEPSPLEEAMKHPGVKEVMDFYRTWLRKQSAIQPFLDAMTTRTFVFGSNSTTGSRIPRRKLEEQGLKITHLENDQTLQDVFLSIFHAVTHTFQNTLAVKIIENDQGRAFIKAAGTVPALPQGPTGLPTRPAPV
jgi:hypothetical protein